MIYWRVETKKDEVKAQRVVRKLRKLHGDTLSQIQIVKHLKSAGVEAFICDDDLGATIDIDVEQ